MDFFENIVWGFCRWDLVAIIFLIAVTAWFFIRRHQRNKGIEEKEQIIN